MKTFRYLTEGRSGEVEAVSPVKAAQTILGTAEVYCARDWTGQTFIQPMVYVGALYDSGAAVKNVECKIWET